MTLANRLALACLCLALSAGAAAAHDYRALGDNRLVTTPTRDHLMACAPANPNAPGAQRAVPWIQGNRVDLRARIAVQGAVRWPDASFVATLMARSLRIIANNLPFHPTGIFPVQRSDPAYAYDRNPNAIRAQAFDVALPADPQVAARPSCVPVGVIGYTVANVVLFSGVDARGQDAPAHEVLDSCAGHPEERGIYHYHDLSPCLTTERDAQGHSALLGYAIDGFGIYGPFDGPGTAEITNAQLDACHGHVGPVMWHGVRRTMYHYHMNGEFPFSVGCLVGTPVRTR